MRAKESLGIGPLIVGSLFQISFFPGGNYFWFWVGVCGLAWGCGSVRSPPTNVPHTRTCMCGAPVTCMRPAPPVRACVSGTCQGAWGVLHALLNRERGANASGLGMRAQGRSGVGPPRGGAMISALRVWEEEQVRWIPPHVLRWWAIQGLSCWQKSVRGTSTSFVSVAQRSGVDDGHFLPPPHP